jgi:hypothetical protein
MSFEGILNGGRSHTCLHSYAENSLPYVLNFHKGDSK